MRKHNVWHKFNTCLQWWNAIWCQKILFYKPMPINYKCRETYSKAMLEIDTCGKSLSVFLSKSFVSKRVFFLSPCHARGFPLNCLRYSQSLGGDPSFHAPPYVCHDNNTTTNDKQSPPKELVASLLMFMHQPKVLNSARKNALISLWYIILHVM